MTNSQDMFLYLRIDVWKKMPKKRKKHPPQGDDVSTVYLKGGRGEQGEARPAISAPRGRPHLDLGRLRLGTWSKYDFSIAETTWPPYLLVIGGIRRDLNTCSRPICDALVMFAV